MENFKLTVLGTRGSVPVEGKNFSIYGGATSSYKVQAGDEEIYLDAGSGIVSSLPEKNSNITILLTHMHLDHLVGLPFFVALTQKDRPIKIFAAERVGLPPKAAIDKIISNPFWPCKIEDYPAKVSFHLLPKKFSIGQVEVDTLEGSHPKGSTIYRLTYKGKSIVHATDFEHNTEACAALAAFARLPHNLRRAPRRIRGKWGICPSVPMLYFRATTFRNLACAERQALKTAPQLLAAGAPGGGRTHNL